VNVRSRRRRIVSGSTGRRYSVCGLRHVGDRSSRVESVARSSGIVAWVSGATLVLAASLSLYAIVRPPAPAVDFGTPASAPIGRYSLADFFNATR
jgi:hypothetical protein